jgi:hypothetical protein
MLRGAYCSTLETAVDRQQKLKKVKPSLQQMQIYCRVVYFVNLYRNPKFMVKVKSSPAKFAFLAPVITPILLKGSCNKKVGKI